VKGKFVLLFGIALALILPSSAYATIAAIDSVNVSISDGVRPEDGGATKLYLLDDLTVGTYTVTSSQLAVGTATIMAGKFQSDGTFIDWSGNSANDSSDNLDLNDLVARDHKMLQSPYTDWYVTMINGKLLYSDQNGDKPDFFLFEAGANDEMQVRAILADGTQGMWTAIIPTTSWGDTGLKIQMQNFNNNQKIGGVCFSITDLLDAAGTALTNADSIQGVEFQTLGMDPTSFSAYVPEPATLMLLSIGLLMLRRRRS